MVLVKKAGRSYCPNLSHVSGATSASNCGRKICHFDLHITCIHHLWDAYNVDQNASKYVFDPQRTLNELSKINGETIHFEITQKYQVPMCVNHAMDDLHNVKDNELLGQPWVVPEMMRVGLVGI